MYKTVYKEVEVDVDLTDFDTDDLVEELESRGTLPADQGGVASELINAIYEKRRVGKDYQIELDALIYTVIGRF